MLRMVAVALLLAVPASAGLTLQATAPAAPLAPEVESGVLRVLVSMDCMEVVSRRAPTGPLTIEMELRAPPYVVLAGPTLLEVPQDQCPTPQGRGDLQAEYTVSLLRSAPGLTAIQVEVRARFTGQPLVPLTATGSEAEVSTTVIAAPYHLLQMRVLSKMECVCPEAVFEVVVENFGNTETLVSFDLASMQEGVSVFLPEAVVLGSPNMGASITNATVQVRASLDDVHQGAFTLLATPRSARDPSAQGNPLTANFLAVAPLQDQPLDVRDAPLPAAPLLGLLLLGLALFTRRRA